MDAASRERSATEQDIEAELRKAMAAGPAAQTNQPQALPVPTLHMTCSPDLSRCPLGWVRNKNICVRGKAGPENNRCGSKYSFGALSQSQKEALAESCGWTFPCQTDQCQMNFEEICPTLWREERGGACLAPASYVGACGKKYMFKAAVLLWKPSVASSYMKSVEVGGMNASDKQTLAYRCGVRLLADIG